MKLQNKHALMIFGFGLLFLMASSLPYYFYSRHAGIVSVILSGSIIIMCLAVIAFLFGKRTVLPVVESDKHILHKEIENRRKVESVLLEYDRRFKSMLSSVKDTVWAATLDSFKMLYMSPAADSVYGRPADSFLENSSLWFDIIHPEDRDSVMKNAREAVKNKKNTEQIYRIFRPDGEIRWLLNKNAVTVDKKGIPFQISGIATDITENKKIEQKLINSEKRLLHAQKVAKMGFLTWNLKSNEMYWSDEVFNLYGIDKQKVRPTVELTMSLVHPDDKEFVKENIDKALKGIKKYDIDHRNLRPDGKVIWVHAQGELMHDAEGNPETLLGTVVDITDRKNAEEEKEKLQQKIIQSDKMAALSEIGAGFAHEMNTPLNVILGYLEFMREKIDAYPELKEYVDISIEEVMFCAGLIRDFLFYARPADNTVSPECLINIAHVLKNLVKLSVFHKEKKIKIKFNGEENLSSVKGNQKQIMQVFMNIINNAIQAMPGGGDITISTRHIKPKPQTSEREMVEFRICDTGEGISEENIAKVFDPFFTSKRPGKGTGLGLALCQRIMEKHNGILRIESEPGKGTTVIGQLPVENQSK